MEFTGSYRMPALPAEVWAALNDAAVLKACIDGCEDLERLSETEFRAKVLAKVGPVQARFAGAVVLSDLEPPFAYTISGQGQGGVAGFVKGSARVVLADAGDGATLLTYTARANVGGKLASVGGRLIQGAATKTADGFFARLAALLDASSQPCLASLVSSSA